MNLDEALAPLRQSGRIKKEELTINSSDEVVMYLEVGVAPSDLGLEELQFLFAFTLDELRRRKADSQSAGR